MYIYNGWIFRALAVRLRQPGMKAQRWFMLGMALVFAAAIAWALVFLFRQETEQALEEAALIVFALFGALIAIALLLAYVVRKKTGARWTTEEALEMAGEKHRNRDQTHKQAHDQTQAESKR
jgi:type VI protein secretion system component VasK